VRKHALARLERGKAKGERHCALIGSSALEKFAGIMQMMVVKSSPSPLAASSAFRGQQTNCLPLVCPQAANGGRANGKRGDKKRLTPGQVGTRSDGIGFQQVNRLKIITRVGRRAGREREGERTKEEPLDALKFGSAATQPAGQKWPVPLMDRVPLSPPPPPPKRCSGRRCVRRPLGCPLSRPAAQLSRPASWRPANISTGSRVCVGDSSSALSPVSLRSARLVVLGKV